MPGELGSVQADAGDTLPRYEIEAALDFGQRKLPAVISGSLRLTVPRASVSADAILLRLYPNDAGYGDGSLSIVLATVDGVAVTPALSAGDTVAALPAAPGQQDVAVKIDFITRVPVHSRHGFGMFSADPDARVLTLAHWYPMLAGVGPEGPALAPPSQIGDPVFSGSALYDVTLTAPADLALITGGSVIEGSVVDGRQRVRIAGGPAREFAMVAARGFEPLTVLSGDVSVTSWAPAAEREGSARVAGWAAAALDAFSRRFGPYPFRELNLVAKDLYGAAGMEFPGLILVSPVHYREDDGERRFGEMVVAHEVAHQWWYGTVLNDQNIDAFVDEGISEYLAARVYFEDLYGLSEGRRQFGLLVEDWMEGQLAAGGDVVVDAPTDAYPDRATYAAAVYAKASLALDAIRAEIGDDAFFGALRELAVARRFDVIAAADVRDAFGDACGCDIGPLWAEWFEQRRMDPPGPATPTPTASSTAG
ncbi:MAG: M1 family aminopeptidase [Chloroflexota bacterium]